MNERTTIKSAIIFLVAEYIRLVERRNVPQESVDVCGLISKFGLSTFADKSIIVKNLPKVISTRKSMRDFGRIPMANESCKPIFDALGF